MQSWKIIAVLIICIASAGALWVILGTPVTIDNQPKFVVSIYDPTKAYGGTTLFTDSYNMRVVEVDMNGNILWEFDVPQGWLSGKTVVGFDAQLLPDNHVLITVSQSGIYEVDRSGNVVWSHSDPKVSHDSDRLPNGNTIYVFGNGDQENDAAVKEITSDGTLVWSWYARDNYLQRYPPSQYAHQGYAHTNAVQRLSDNKTLISLRNFGLTTVVDENGDVVREYDWSSFGSDTDPHEPQIYENGGTLVVCLQNDSPYVVVEIDRENGDTLWAYSNANLRTTRDADKLPNGNFLIVAVNNGGTSDYVNTNDDFSTIIEVTPQGEIVWQLDFKNAPVGRNPGWFYKAERINPPALISND